MADEETTNKVLETKIDGLAKLTDTQLGYVNETLKDLKSLMGAFSTKTELEEAKKDWNKAFEAHAEDDKIAFAGLSKQMAFLTKVIYLGMGGLTVLVFIIHFIFKF
jgi:hypothetical protein